MKKSLLKPLLIIPIFLWSLKVLAHGNTNPADDIRRDRAELSRVQSSFVRESDSEIQIKNLLTQVKIMSGIVLELRNSMAREYPHVKENMSKYKFDYSEELDVTLKSLKVSITQLETTLDN